MPRARNLKVKIYSLRRSLESRPQLVGSHAFCPAARPGWVAMQIVRNYLSSSKFVFSIYAVRPLSYASCKEKTSRLETQALETLSQAKEDLGRALRMIAGWQIARLLSDLAQTQDLARVSELAAGVLRFQYPCSSGN